MIRSIFHIMDSYNQILLKSISCLNNRKHLNWIKKKICDDYYDLVSSTSWKEGSLDLHFCPNKSVLKVPNITNILEAVKLVQTEQNVQRNYFRLWVNIDNPRAIYRFSGNFKARSRGLIYKVFQWKTSQVLSVAQKKNSDWGDFGRFFSLQFLNQICLTKRMHLMGLTTI